MTGRLPFIWVTFLAVILAGCWDARLLKEHSLVLSIGYDLGTDETIIKTVTFPKESSGNPKQNSPATQSNVITTTGDTVKDAEHQLDRLIPEKFDRSKAKVILLGENLATNGIYSTLDSIYRDLRGPLNASVAVVKGTAKDALNIKENYSRPVSDFYSELLTSAGGSGLTKNENVQSICPIMLSDLKDIAVPYIRVTEDSNMAIVDGMALFSGDKMTGKLNIKESSMLLILTDNTPKGTKMNLKVSNDKEKHDKNFVDFVIRKTKRKLNVYTDNDEIKAKIDLTLQVEIDEYSTDQLHNEKKAKALSKEIEKKLNEIAVKTIASIQEANNDSLGLGEKVKAYHHSIWEKIDWGESYPEVPIETTFNVEIVRHGILN